LPGKQVGLLISGPLMQIPNLRQLLEGHFEVQQANVVGMVTDECADSTQLDRLLDSLARRLRACAETGYVRPLDFLGVGGTRLFRDEIWAYMRVAFPADHRYYKKHGLYNFPKRSIRTRIRQGFLALMLNVPAFRREFRKRVQEELAKPLAKLLEES
jgi:hypothetical protein